MGNAEFLPEAILRGDHATEEGDWQVRRAEGIGQSCTDLSRRLITVPEASSDGRVLTRLHEGLHVKYSDASPKQSSRPSAALFRQMLEEIRVDALGAQQHALDMSHRFDDYDLGPESPLWVQPRSHQAKLRAALYYLQTYGQRTSPEVAPLQDHLKSLFTPNELANLDNFADAAEQAYYTKSPRWDDFSHEWAEKLAQELDPPPPPLKVEKAVEKPQPKPKPGEQDEPSLPGQMADMPRNGEGDTPQGGHGGAERHGTWTLCRHINRANPGKTLRLPMGAKDRGSEPKLWHRFCEDKQIFSNRRMGGTLLIDASGSMSWDYDALRRAMREFPAATVAIYEGTGMRQLYGNGVLCIVAENGRWDDPARNNCSGQHHSGGNDIDLESLQWLARQKAPRLWLSDGGVCGGAHTSGEVSLRGKCHAVARKGRIARTLQVEEAIKFFRRRGNHRSSLLHLPTEGEPAYYSR